MGDESSRRSRFMRLSFESWHPCKKYMCGCQNYGPFFGYPKYSVPYYNKDPKRDHDFDNHPYA